MISISTASISSSASSSEIASRSGLSVHHLHPVLLEQAGQGKDIAHIVVHDEDFLAAQRIVGSGAAVPTSAACRAAVRRRRDAGTKLSSSSNRSGDCTPLSTTLSAICDQLEAHRSSVRSLPVNTTMGKSRSSAFCRMRSSNSKPEISGSRRSSTTQSNFCACKALPRLGAVRRRRQYRRLSWPSSSTMLWRSISLSSTTSRRRWRD